MKDTSRINNKIANIITKTAYISNLYVNTATLAGMHKVKDIKANCQKMASQQEDILEDLESRLCAIDGMLSERMDVIGVYEDWVKSTKE